MIVDKEKAPDWEPYLYSHICEFARLSMLQMLTSVINNISCMYNSNTLLKGICKHYNQIIGRIVPIRQR